MTSLVILFQEMPDNSVYIGLNLEGSPKRNFRYPKDSNRARVLNEAFAEAGLTDYQGIIDRFVLGAPKRGPFVKSEKVQYRG